MLLSPPPSNSTITDRPEVEEEEGDKEEEQRRSSPAITLTDRQMEECRRGSQWLCSACHRYAIAWQHSLAPAQWGGGGGGTCSTRVSSLCRVPAAAEGVACRG